MADYLFAVADVLKLADELIFWLMACSILICFSTAFWSLLRGGFRD